MSGKYNIVADQATTFNFEFQILEDNTPWDLSGYSGVMTVRPFIGATTTTLVCSTDNSRMTIVPLTGRIEINVSAAIMADIPASRYVYDLVITSGGGVVTRILEGKFIVTAAVTQ